LSSLTLNIVFGRASRMTPSISIFSSFDTRSGLRWP
jgi:flagellar biosynthesis protein FliR